MENPAHTVRRLVEALEKLGDQEALQVEHGDHAGVLETRLRMTPLVATLREVGIGAVDAPTRARVAAVAQRRRQSRERLALHVGHLRDELSRTTSGLRMLARVVPLYIRRAQGQARCRLSAMT
jgi:hypothetical protein